MVAVVVFLSQERNHHLSEAPHVQPGGPQVPVKRVTALVDGIVVHQAHFHPFGGLAGKQVSEPAAHGVVFILEEYQVYVTLRAGHVGFDGADKTVKIRKGSKAVALDGISR